METPGDLIYLSERKLSNLAIYFGVKTASLDPHLDIEGGAGLAVGVPSVGQVSAQTSVRGGRTDPNATARSQMNSLKDVVKKLGGDGLPNLETADRIREAGWFRFHRRLRFGIGSSDSQQSVRALVVVDEKHVPKDLSIPALLMTGSPEHVRPPYTSDELRNAPGSRSGSGSGLLFQWLDRARRALEDDPEADLNEIEVPAILTDLLDQPLRDIKTAAEMYRVFSENHTLNQPQFPQLLHGAPCEGVAQASFIAASDDITLVMGSPLFLRVRALPESDTAAESRWPRLRRFFGASDSRSAPQ